MNESKKNTAVGFLGGIVAAALLLGLLSNAPRVANVFAGTVIPVASPASNTGTHELRTSAASGDVAAQQSTNTAANRGRQSSGEFSKRDSVATGQWPTTPPMQPGIETQALPAQRLPIGLGAQGTSPQMATMPVTVRRSHSKARSVAIVAGSAGTGAAIGAVAGGKKGAAIGAVSGAVAGFIYDRLSDNK